MHPSHWRWRATEMALSSWQRERADLVLNQGLHGRDVLRCHDSAYLILWASFGHLHDDHLHQAPGPLQLAKGSQLSSASSHSRPSSS
jgi:hypothetical protein